MGTRYQVTDDKEYSAVLTSQISFTADVQLCVNSGTGPLGGMRLVNSAPVNFNADDTYFPGWSQGSAVEALCVGEDGGLDRALDLVHSVARQEQQRVDRQPHSRAEAPPRRAAPQGVVGTGRSPGGRRRDGGRY